ncbi:hypothetical protein [Tropicimonas sp. IMCC34043]|uniref:hypothetical protein n=1 Tax=Tropicimonas sp. IMCC34043 TaxID=2248760 RepID=UPI000E283E8E|nr:hypothetical protein [Tropicimonas sp. IMCC34043]
MAKHILDRPRQSMTSRVAPYAAVLRRNGPEGSSRAAQVLLRRSKGPMNAALRNKAFLRIERDALASS